MIITTCKRDLVRLFIAPAVKYVLMLLVASVLFYSGSADAGSYTVSDSCGTGTITWTISGVENLVKDSETSGAYCWVRYLADFPKIGNPVSFSMSYSPASSGNLNEYGMNTVNGIFPNGFVSRDWCYDMEGNPIAGCVSLVPFTTGYCYSGVRGQLWFGAQSFGFDGVTEVGLPGGLGVLVDASPRSEICTGTAEECLYSMKTKHKGAGT